MTVSAYAKVNFTLEVLGTRADGYHTLRSLVVPVSLADTLTIEPAETLSSDTGYADDLILKAARVL
jgi:4-diphosphocytidyl-2-C-methyl-D-erythritol kinase